MADFTWDPLRAAALMLIGGDTVLSMPSPTALTLTGLTPSLSFQLNVPTATVQASKTIAIPDVDGGAASFTYTLGSAIAIGADGNNWALVINSRETGSTLLEARVGETPSTANTPVWTAVANRIGVAIRDANSFTVQDLIDELASIGVVITTASSPSGVLGNGDQALSAQTFTGGVSTLNFTRNTPAIQVGLICPSPVGLTLTGNTPAMNLTLGVPAATALTLTGLQPSLDILAPDGTHTVIGPRVGASIGLKIDPRMGG